MSVLLLVMTDGRRNCIEQAIPHALTHLDGPLKRKVIHDDSGDAYYQSWLAEQFPDFEQIRTPGRSGFGGAIRNAWDHLNRTAEDDQCRYVFHLEDDFVIERNVDLSAMAACLQVFPHLVQLALRRQPWNDEERAAGGIVESHPNDYQDRRRGIDIRWLEHRRFFTTNPSLYRRSLCWRGWPDGDHSEGLFTHELLEDPDTRFGFWGARNSGEWVTHIGTERAGTGY